MTDSNKLREKLWSLRWPLAVGIVTAIGLALRVWKAWAMRYQTNGDFGIVALMAKHMAEGTDYPVFCYGVNYMGSIEPAIAALVAKFFRVEVSAFLVNLSPAVVGSLLLPLLYVFAREAGSRRAGLMAMLYCLVGSDTLFHFSVAPRGGYPNMLVGGLFALWMACRISTGERKGEPVTWRAYFGMGLACGLVWWVTPLSGIFLATVCLVLLAGMRPRMIKPALLFAAPGFLIGSLPWWVWNLAHHSASRAADSLKHVSFVKEMSWFGKHFLKVTEMEPLNSLAGWPRLLLLIGMLACFMWLLVRDRVRREHDDKFFYRLGVFLLAGVMFLVYCTTSHDNVNADRYLLPLVPALAIMIGTAGDRLLCRFRFPWGWIAAIAVIPTHILLLPRLNDGVPANRRKWDLAAQLEKEVAAFPDSVFIGDYYSFHWLNFASQERLCVAALPVERYAPYARRAELAEHPAFLNDYCGVLSFQLATGGGGVQTNVLGVMVDHGLTPPSDDWTYLEPAFVVSAEDSSGNSCDRALLDGVMDTCWSVGVETNAPAVLTFTFDKCVALRGIRLLSPDWSRAQRIMVEGQTADDARWKTIVPTMAMSDYFWSGRYVMLKGIQSFQELRFDVPAGGLKRLRLTCVSGGSPYPLSLGEILFLEQAAPPAAGDPTVDACLSALRTNQVRQLYGPRWMADRVALAAGNAIKVRVPSLIGRSLQELPERDSECPYPVAIRENTGFLMDARDAVRSRKLLSERHVKWEETALGRCVLLVVPKPGEEEEAARYETLYWTEQGVFAADMGRFARKKADWLYREAMDSRSPGSRSARLNLLEEALAVYSAHQPARRALVEALEASGRHGEAATNSAILRGQTVPEVPAQIRYPYGIEFLGLGFSSSQARPGGSIEIRYFWKCPPEAESRRPAVFVHFLRGEEIGFQDDHDLLSKVPVEDIKAQSLGEVFVEQRVVAIPAGAAVGEYRIGLGLFRRQDGRRLRPKTNLPEQRRETQLPVTVRVGP